MGVGWLLVWKCYFVISFCDFIGQVATFIYEMEHSESKQVLLLAVSSRSYSSKGALLLMINK